MPAPTTTLLIEGSFSELAEELAQYIDAVRKTEGGSSLHADIAAQLEVLRKQEQPEEEITDAQHEQALKQRDEVLKKIVGAASVLNAAPEKELTAAYNLLIHLIHQSASVDMFLSRICTYLAKPITSSPQHGAPIALTILSTVFNTLAPADSSRYHVFLAVIAVIRQTGSTTAFEALKPQLVNQLPNWLAAWELDEEEEQKLHLAISEAANDAGDGDLLHTHLIKALQTIPPSESSSKESRDLAVRGLTTALTHPAVFDFTPLTASDAVQSLRSTDTTLFELLEIFAADTLDAYEDFIADTPLSSTQNETLSTPAAAEALQNKMRLLTLASLAASTPSRSLPYATIAGALRVPTEDVEKWVIDTIRAGLVEGKLSQLKSEFLVQRATYRVFGEKQWAEVQGRLMVWRRSLESVLGVVRSEKERFVRESLAQVQAAQTQAEGKESGKQNGERRRGGGRGEHREREPREQPRELDLVGGD